MHWPPHLAVQAHQSFPACHVRATSKRSPPGTAPHTPSQSQPPQRVANSPQQLAMPVLLLSQWALPCRQQRPCWCPTQYHKYLLCCHSVQICQGPHLGLARPHHLLCSCHTLLTLPPQAPGASCSRCHRHTLPPTQPSSLCAPWQRVQPRHRQT